MGGAKRGANKEKKNINDNNHLSKVLLWITSSAYPLLITSDTVTQFNILYFIYDIKKDSTWAFPLWRKEEKKESLEKKFEFAEVNALATHERFRDYINWRPILRW